MSFYFKFNLWFTCLLLQVLNHGLECTTASGMMIRGELNKSGDIESNFWKAWVGMMQMLNKSRGRESNFWRVKRPSAHLRLLISSSWYYRIYIYCILVLYWMVICARYSILVTKFCWLHELRMVISSYHMYNIVNKCILPNFISSCSYRVLPEM